jgi:hypothetical protein
MKYRIPALLLASVLSLTTLGWPGDSGAQNKIPRVGILYIVKFTENPNAPFFFRTLRDHGWIEDRLSRSSTATLMAIRRSLQNPPKSSFGSGSM